MRVAQLKTNVQVEARLWARAGRKKKECGWVGKEKNARAGGEQSVGIGRGCHLCTDCAPWIHKAAITLAVIIIQQICRSYRYDTTHITYRSVLKPSRTFNSERQCSFDDDVCRTHMSADKEEQEDRVCPHHFKGETREVYARCVPAHPLWPYV